MVERRHWYKGNVDEMATLGRAPNADLLAAAIEILRKREESEITPPANE